MIGKVGFEPTRSLSSVTQFHMNPKTLLRVSLKVANLLAHPFWIVFIMFPRGLLSLQSAAQRRGLALTTQPLTLFIYVVSFNVWPNNIPYWESNPDWQRSTPSFITNRTIWDLKWCHLMSDPTTKPRLGFEPRTMRHPNYKGFLKRACQTSHFLPIKLPRL